MLVKTFGCAIQGITATVITIEVVIFLYEAFKIAPTRP
jgi:hypothetical protein